MFQRPERASLISTIVLSLGTLVTIICFNALNGLLSFLLPFVDIMTLWMLCMFQHPERASLISTKLRLECGYQPVDVSTP